VPETGYWAVFLIGLLGGVHCVGMCGGIVTALSAPTVVRLRPVVSFRRHLGYNLGRVLSYTLLGAVVGAVGSGSLLFNRVLPVQLGLFILANLVLICMGLYLMGQLRALSWVESLGQFLWLRVQPMARKMRPVRNGRQAVSVGCLWGFLPCGLSYGVLSLALVSGSAWRGAGLMLAFGAGTLPNLLLAGMLMVKYQAFARKRALRVVAGVLVLSFGVYGLIRAPDLGGRLWAGICAS
jgi:sulfite exporter TauE/SafE